MEDIVVERKAIVFAVDPTEFIPAPIIENTSRRYTCTLVGKSVQVGIPLGEQELCPEFIKEVGVSASSSEWTERVDEFWSEWRMDVPISKLEKGQVQMGLIIDGSYEWKKGKLYPKNINEFIAYNLMMNDYGVGKTEQDYNEDIDQYDFFILDLKEKDKAEAVKATTLIEVSKKLGQLFEKENHLQLIKQMLLISKKYDYYDIAQMTDAALTNEIVKYANANLETFVSMLGAKDLELRALINEMGALGVLTVVDNVYYNGTNKIGKMKEALTYFSSGDDQVTVEIEKLKDTLEEVKLRDVISK